MLPNQSFNMDTARQKLRSHWATRFTGLDSEWPYWWIEGDGYCLAVLDGANLAAAVDIIEDNWEQYARIKSSKAKIVDMRKKSQIGKSLDRFMKRHKMKPSNNIGENFPARNTGRTRTKRAHLNSIVMFTYK